MFWFFVIIILLIAMPSMKKSEKERKEKEAIALSNARAAVIDGINAVLSEAKTVKVLGTRKGDDNYTIYSLLIIKNDGTQDTFEVSSEFMGLVSKYIEA